MSAVEKRLTLRFGSLPMMEMPTKQAWQIYTSPSDRKSGLSQANNRHPSLLPNEWRLTIEFS